MAIDLTDPGLAERLLADLSNRLALEVFRGYIYAFPDAPNPGKLLLWTIPSLAPVKAIHLAYPAVGHAWLAVSNKWALKKGLTPEQAKAVSETLEYICDLLIRGRSQPKRGRPPELKQEAAIAFVLSHYTSLKWPEIADRLLVVRGACKRCKLPKHGYLAGSRDDPLKTPCVNVLLNEYSLLKRDFAEQKIPLPPSNKKSRKEH
jgi:hypothetical protein